MIENDTLVRNSLNHIKQLLKDEINQSLLYQYIIDTAPSRFERELLLSMKECILYHFEVLKNILIDHNQNYSNFSEELNFECSTSYTECIKEALLFELNTLQICKEIRNGFSKELYKELLINIIFEKINILSNFNYLLICTLNDKIDCFSYDNMNRCAHDEDELEEECNNDISYEDSKEDMINDFNETTKEEYINLNDLQKELYNECETTIEKDTLSKNSEKTIDDLRIKKIAYDFIEKYFDYNSLNFDLEYISTYNDANDDERFFEYKANNSSRDFNIRVLDKTNTAFYGYQKLKNVKNKSINSSQAKKIATSFLKNKYPELFKEISLSKESNEIDESKKKIKHYCFNFSNSNGDKNILIKVDSLKSYISLVELLINDF